MSMADQAIEVGGVQINKPTNDAPQDLPSTEPIDFLSELVGEGKRYASVADLAKGKLHADEHIKTIEEENARMREQFEAQTKNSETLEKVLERLQTIDNPARPVIPEPEDPDDDNHISRDSIASIVQDLMNETKAQESAAKQAEVYKRNQAEAWSKLAAIYDGQVDKAQLAVAEFVGDNANRARVLDEMTRLDPEGFVKFMQAQKRSDVEFVPSAKSSAPKVDVASVGELTWEKARAIRKSNPELYNSRQFQDALIKARDRNERAFWGKVR
jgi:hypothetical protein